MIIKMSIQEALDFPIWLSHNLHVYALHTDTPKRTS